MGIKLARPVEGGDLLRRRRQLHDGQLRARHRGDAARALHRRADRQPRLRLHQPAAAGMRRRRVQQHVQGQRTSRRSPRSTSSPTPPRWAPTPRRPPTSPTSRRRSSPPAAAPSLRSSSSTPRRSPAPAPAATGGTSPCPQVGGPERLEKARERYDANAAPPARLQLRPLPMILYGTNPIAWSNDDDWSLGDHLSLEDCLGDCRRIGFDGIEKGHKMPDDGDRAEGQARRVRPALRRRLALDQPPRQRHRDREEGAPGLDRLHQGGRRRPHQRLRMLEHRARQRQGAGERPPDHDRRRVGALLEGLRGARRLAAEQGVKMGYHHHMGTIVESAADIDRFMAMAGPHTRLLLDTGHAHFGGADPAEVARKYMDRVTHIHAKNIRPEIMREVREQNLSFLEGVRRGAFTVPGRPRGLRRLRAGAEDRRRARLLRLARHRGRAGQRGARALPLPEHGPEGAPRHGPRRPASTPAAGRRHDRARSSASPSAPTARCTRSPPGSAGWRYVGFSLYRLRAGETAAEATGGNEVDPRHGRGQGARSAPPARTGASSASGWTSSRRPRRTASTSRTAATGRATAETDCTIAVCSAPGQGGHPPRRIGPDGITLTERGKGTNTRHINNIAMENEDFCDSLLVTEVFTPAGHWSSYPSHRHDEDDFPRITYLEETYYHRLNPTDGFGIQRVYTDDGLLDETMAVRDGDVTLVPRGHHPCGAPYGFEMYYLNVMAGPLPQLALRARARGRVDHEARRLTTARRGTIPPPVDRSGRPGFAPSRVAPKPGGTEHGTGQMGHPRRGEDRARVGLPGHPHRATAASSPPSPAARPARPRRSPRPTAPAPIDSYEALLADPGDRRDLHSAAERRPRRMDAEGARRRQARADREADRARRRRHRPPDRRARPCGQARRRGLHGHPPPAVAAGARAGAGRRHRPAAPGAGRASPS